MSYLPNNDNIYEPGTIITAKSTPDVKLKIVKYYQRIYYCSTIGDETGKQSVYFERELLSPIVR
jgi:hypothetical protein